MKKLAKLVTISLVTRVIVNENASTTQVLDIAKNKFIAKINSELEENLEFIEDDTECPFGTLGKYDEEITNNTDTTLKSLNI